MPKNKKITQYIDMILMIDSSGSMEGERLEHAKAAAIDFVQGLDFNRYKISVLEFHVKYKYHCRFSNDRDKVISAINEINVLGSFENFCEVIGKNYRNFPRDSVNTKIMVILTDGRWKYQFYEWISASIAKSKGIYIFAIGFGEADEKFLRRISSKGFGQKVDLTQLKKAFSEVTNKINSEDPYNNLG